MRQLIAVVAVAALIPVVAGARSKSDPGRGLKHRVVRLEAENADLRARIDALEAALGRVEAILQFVRVEDDPINGLAGPHWIVRGANVHIQSGSGTTTDGCTADEPNCSTLSGRGNLIVGYNENEGVFGFGSEEGRKGSHNLVVGPGHGYTTFAGFVAGNGNTVTGAVSAVSGGSGNRATGAASSVSGGSANLASATVSSVGGGFFNRATGDSSSISGGTGNTATGGASWVGGGGGNSALGIKSSVCGGGANRATGEDSSITGGSANTASGFASSVGGGFSNDAIGDRSSVSAGEGNVAEGFRSSVSGGQNRTAPSDFNWAAGSLLEPN